MAEEIVFGEITTGASNDLQQVTKMAQSMVTRYGMSDEMGLRVYGDRQEMVFLGREISEQRDYSDAVAEQIDLQVRIIIDTEYERVHQILKANRDKLELVAQALLEVETLEAHEFVAVMEGKELPAKPPVGETGQSEPTKTQPDADVEWNQPPSLDLPPSPSPA